jgi:hypothetical protein
MAADCKPALLLVASESVSMHDQSSSTCVEPTALRTKGAWRGARARARQSGAGACAGGLMQSRVRCSGQVAHRSGELGLGA